MTPRIVIVGAGFGGIGIGIQLRRAGIDSFTILEKADGVGGVWRANTYPGLTCDVPSHLYSFSFEPNHDWTRRFPPQAEILAYLERCADRHGLRDHIRLGTEVVAAEFDHDRGGWRIELTGGERIDTDVLVAATGQLSRPAYPSISGLDEFEERASSSTPRAGTTTTIWRASASRWSGPGRARPSSFPRLPPGCRGCWSSSARRRG